MSFRQMHCQSTPLLLANVWDVTSAQAAQAAGYQALGTSSAAIADMLGYKDGEEMPFSVLLALVARIRERVDLPLSVDMEAGYGDDTETVVRQAIQLAELGAVGINLEDSKVERGERRLLDVRHFAARLSAIKAGLDTAKKPLFINARTDGFLLGEQDALKQTLARGKLYQQAGADGFFVPCVTLPEDIQAIAGAVDLPLNVMCMPGLPDVNQLAALGVKRVSMGNFVHAALNRKLQHLLFSLRQRGAFDEIFADENP
ncbi:isocitrate lyase/phosphoenolpyruvate mutase family protein [Enterobacter sp. Cy-643]|uniref:isocitrate lyase/PEP mutase family protein n=1 Tax=Enterobacter sp. Cy-643 TaxID=2608346 RepID=UPI001423A772|nr:isocitrate lyase/phosphoenolpyruvate mutase family protein [Enterobacter sp. Cy-643]NIF33501.1 isocitrate lyase/phosphoenolpyruvate mutase family protein [Enterobacter sp. Cy-643]